MMPRQIQEGNVLCNETDLGAIRTLGGAQLGALAAERRAKSESRFPGLELPERTHAADGRSTWVSDLR